MRLLCDGDTFEYRGRTFKVELRPDNDFHQTPWDDDGHGEVSEWTSREKAPGERVLCTDRGSKRYYDFAGAVRTARKENWGCKHSKIVDGVFVSGHTSKGELAACAAESDYDRIRRWCNDDWCYLTIGVTLLDEDEDGEPTIETDEREYLGGVESDCDDYVAEVCNELAAEIMTRVEVDTPDAVLSEN